MNKSRVLSYGLVLLVLVGVLLATLVVYNTHLQTLHFSLNKGVTLGYTRALIATLLRKIVCATILLVSGVYCVYLHLQTYESEDYLVYSVLFMLAAGIIMTLMDYFTLFYASPLQRTIWHRCADMSVLLFSGGVVQVLCITSDDKAKNRRAQLLLWTIHVLLAGTVFFLKPIRTWSVLRYYAYGICAFSVLYTLLSLHTARAQWDIFRLLWLFGLDAMLLLVGQYKLDTLDPMHEIYTDMLPLFLVVYTLLLFNAFFQNHRRGVLLGRIGVRKQMEVTQYKEAVMGTFMLYCNQPIESLAQLAETIDITPDKPAALTGIGGAIRSEVATLRRKLDDGLQYARLRGSPMTFDMNKVDMGIVFHHVKTEMERGADAPDIILRITRKVDGYVTGDPHLLIRANYTLTLCIGEIAREHPVTVLIHETEGRIAVQISARYDPQHAAEAKQLARRLNRRDSVRANIRDEDLSLVIAKSILFSHDCEVTAQDDGTHMRLHYTLPMWAGVDAQDTPDGTDAGVTTEKHAIQVALISTSSSQVAYIRNYLRNAPIQLHVFDDRRRLMCHLDENRVNVVIVGTVFLHTSAVDICHDIRRRYAMGSLPIILIRQSDLMRLDSSFVQHANDILTEPFSYLELTQRIFSLSMLQRSTDAFHKARLEFLQSQMDPHFIFNAISSILPLCLRAPQEAYSLLGSFSEYLRGNIFPKQNNQPIFVYEEMDLVRAYLALENARLQDRLHFDIVEEYDDDAMIFPLLIEPIVENSVKHGLHNQQEADATLHIDIRITQQGDMLSILVRDDGAGFDVNQLSLRDDDEKNSKRGYRSIGLGNLNTRLQLYYNTHLSIQSETGKGATVSFRVPRRMQ